MTKQSSITNKHRCMHGPCGKAVVLETDSGLHHNANDSNPVLANEGP